MRVLEQLKRNCTTLKLTIWQWWNLSYHQLDLISRIQGNEGDILGRWRSPEQRGVPWCAGAELWVLVRCKHQCSASQEVCRQPSQNMRSNLSKGGEMSSWVNSEHIFSIPVFCQRWLFRQHGGFSQICSPFSPGGQSNFYTNTWHHGFSHGSPKKGDDGIITLVTFIWLLPNMVDQGSWRPPCTGDHQRQRGSSNRSADRIDILKFMMIYDCKCRTRKRGGGEAVATGA